MKRVQEAESALRSAGLKATSERTSLLMALASSPKPASSKDLLESVTGMDRTTVYRNLEAFVRAGLARKIDVGHRHAHFEASSGEEHHHLICTSCGKIEDVLLCPDPAATKELLSKSSFSAIASHSLEFRGTCKACAK